MCVGSTNTVLSRCTRSKSSVSHWPESSSAQFLMCSVLWSMPMWHCGSVLSPSFTQWFCLALAWGELQSSSETVSSDSIVLEKGSVTSLLRCSLTMSLLRVCCLLWLQIILSSVMFFFTPLERAGLQYPTLVLYCIRLQSGMPFYAYTCTCFRIFVFATTLPCLLLENAHKSITENKPTFTAMSKSELNTASSAHWIPSYSSWLLLIDVKSHVL